MAFNEQFVRSFIENYPKCPDDVAFDIGANVGFYTLRIAPKFQKTYAFEVYGPTADLLSENVKNNNLTEKVVVVNKAVADRDGNDFKLYYVHTNPQGHGGNTLSEHVAGTELWGHNPSIFTTVPGISLDTFVKENKIDNLRFIKMDIEGGENFAWLGAVETLKNNKLDIVLEVHNCVDYDGLFSFFKDLDYKIINSYGRPANNFEPDSHYHITNRDA